MSVQAPAPGDGAAYADRFAAEGPALVSARSLAAGLTGAPAVTPAAGATLAVLASAASARTVVSIGSGGGIAGLWLLEGMRADGVLTVLDSDAEALRATRRAFAEAGHPPGRTRMIFGTTGEVLPRLSPGGYDMVVCAGPPTQYAAHLAAVLELVRVGGTVVCHGLLDGDRIADPRARDEQTGAWRDTARAVREHEGLTCAVLPIGAGLLVATRRR